MRGSSVRGIPRNGITGEEAEVEWDGLPLYLTLIPYSCFYSPCIRMGHGSQAQYVTLYLCG